MPLHEQPVVRQRTNDNELCYCGNWCLFCCRMYIRTEKWAFRSTFYLFIYVKYYQRTDYIIATKVRVNWYDLNESMFRLIEIPTSTDSCVSSFIFVCWAIWCQWRKQNTHSKQHHGKNHTQTHTHIYRFYISIHLNGNALYSMVDVVWFWCACMCVKCISVDEWIKRIDLNIKINDDLMSFTSNILCMITKMLPLFGLVWWERNRR